VFYYERLMKEDKLNNNLKLLKMDEDLDDIIDILNNDRGATTY
jgi:hypothetical protein